MSGVASQICRGNLYSREDLGVDLNGDGFYDLVKFKPEKETVSIAFGKKGGYFQELSQVDEKNLSSLKGLGFFGVPVERLFSKKNEISSSRLFGFGSGLQDFNIQLSPLKSISFQLIVNGDLCGVDMKLLGPLGGLNVFLNPVPQPRDHLYSRD